MTRRLSRITSLALAIAAVAAPSASAIDKVSPDARDAGRAAPTVDLRSPDARDNGRREPAPVVVTAPPVAAADGFHWLDAGLGAAALASLLLLGAGTATTVRTRRGPVRAS